VGYVVRQEALSLQRVHCDSTAEVNETLEYRSRKQRETKTTKAKRVRAPMRERYCASGFFLVALVKFGCVIRMSICTQITHAYALVDEPTRTHTAVFS
jgi:hypothetical protein